MTKIKNLVREYIQNEDGLVTLEWVGIAAVVVIAGIVITGFVMGGADIAAGDVNTAASTVTDQAVTEATAAATALQGLGDGQ